MIDKGSPIYQALNDLAYGPNYDVISYDGFYANGCRFHTLDSTIGLTTYNSGVMVKGSCYGEDNLNYYGVLREVLEIEYPMQRPNKIFLFKCDWYDPERGVVIDPFTGIVDVIPGKYIRRFEPFVLASQVDQICYVPSVGKKRKRDERLTVLQKMTRAYVENNFVREEERETHNDLLVPECERPQHIPYDPI